MIPEKMQELTILSILENNFNNREEYYNYLGEYCDIEKINNRYCELLDEFLNDYALNKTEKSEEHN